MLAVATSVDLGRKLVSYVRSTEHTLELMEAAPGVKNADYFAERVTLHMARQCASILGIYGSLQLYGRTQGHDRDELIIFANRGINAAETLTHSCSLLDPATRLSAAVDAMDRAFLVYPDLLMGNPAFERVWVRAHLKLSSVDADAGIDKHNYINRFFNTARQIETVSREDIQLLQKYVFRKLAYARHG